MKANGIPEKIYLQENTTTDCYGEWWPEWFETRTKDTDIEYTHTDTFIEKALKWVDHTFHETSIDGFVGENLDVVMSDTSIYKYDLLESFKNYMKGSTE